MKYKKKITSRFSFFFLFGRCSIAVSPVAEFNISSKLINSSYNKKIKEKYRSLQLSLTINKFIVTANILDIFRDTFTPIETCSHICEDIFEKSIESQILKLPIKNRTYNIALHEEVLWHWSHLHVCPHTCLHTRRYTYYPAYHQSS